MPFIQMCGKSTKDSVSSSSKTAPALNYLHFPQMIAQMYIQHNIIMVITSNNECFELKFFTLPCTIWIRSRLLAISVVVHSMWDAGHETFYIIASIHLTQNTVCGHRWTETGNGLQSSYTVILYIIQFTQLSGQLQRQVWQQKHRILI